jgi:hypothetical protein
MTSLTYRHLLLGFLFCNLVACSQTSGEAPPDEPPAAGGAAGASDAGAAGAPGRPDATSGGAGAGVTVPDPAASGAAGAPPDPGGGTVVPGIPPLPTRLARREVRGSLRVQTSFTPSVGIFDGEQWRGTAITTWPEPRLLYATGARALPNVRLNRPLDFSQSSTISGTGRSDQCALEGAPQGGGGPRVLCDRGHYVAPSSPPVSSFDVPGLVRWAKAAPAMCALDQAGLRCWSACQTEGYPCRYTPDILAMTGEFGGRPLDFAIEDENGCVLGEASPGRKEVRCFGNDGGSWTNALRGFEGGAFVRAGVSADICMVNAERTDMVCGNAGRLAPALRAALFEGRPGARIDDAYVGESVTCVRAHDRIGCRSGLQGYGPLVLELGGVPPVPSTLTAWVGDGAYRVCLAAAGRLRCQSVPAPADGTGPVATKAAALEDVAADELGSEGVEWAEPNGRALGCFPQGLWFTAPGQPGVNAGAVSCDSVVPRAGLTGAFVLRAPAPASLADTFVPAVAERAEPTPSDFENIVHVGAGGRANVTAPGLLRSSYAVSLGPEGALYIVSHRPQSKEGPVATCSTDATHPGCPERVAFASELLRLAPKPSGGFEAAAEILFAGKTLVGFGFEGPDATLVVAEASRLEWRDGRYQPVDVTIVSIPHVTLR